MGSANSLLNWSVIQKLPSQLWTLSTVCFVKPLLYKSVSLKLP